MEVLAPQGTWSLRFQRKRQLAAKGNLLSRLSREMDAAESMRESPRHREWRPFIGIYPPMHAKELPLAHLATNRIIAQTPPAKFRGSPCPIELKVNGSKAMWLRTLPQPVDNLGLGHTFPECGRGCCG